MFGGEERQAALQQHVGRMRFGEPELPLSKADAIQQAARLKTFLSWRNVAIVMAFYHGWFYTQSGWRYLVEQAGVER